jgi:hypothetical protein
VPEIAINNDRSSAAGGDHAPLPATGRRRAFVLAFILMNLALAGYFLDSIPSPNPTSRVLPVLALFEDGTYAIDRYQDTTMDKSFIDGHYYSDKAPLSTWLVLPVYGLLRQAGLPAADIFYFKWLPVAFIGAVLCGTVPFVVLVWLIARRLEREAPSANAVLLSMLPLYGSFVAAYSGVFIGHLLAGILLTGSYALLTSGRRPGLCGFLVGLAVVAEHPVALALPVWTFFLLRRQPQALPRFVLGGLPCAAVLLLYNYAITGSPLTTPYAYEAHVAFAEMKSAYGMQLPSATALWGLLFSPFRGLLFYAPALAVAAYAYLTARRRHLRPDAISPLGLLTIGYLAMISSYFVWWGGWSYGPRHLLPLAMIFFYEGIPLVATRRSLHTPLLWASVAGIAMVWMAKSTVLHIMPETYANPVFELALPKLLHGDLRSDAVVTRLFGFHPIVAAPMWIVLFLACVKRLHAMTRERRRQPEPPPVFVESHA